MLLSIGEDPVWNMPKRKPFNKTKKFQKLQASWYRRLEREGFKDIEYLDDEGEPRHYQLQDSVVNFSARYKPDREQYYRLAAQYAHSGGFNSEFERWLWSKHAEGQTYRQIADNLKKQRSFPKITKSTVYKRVTKIRREFLNLLRQGQLDVDWDEASQA